ncbi:MAG: hypothetical protein L0271_09105 [Gemmatimonadetes bacterium]|nr:hypothetical protein [Gemmatimonadota bacterium]
MLPQWVDLLYRVIPGRARCARVRRWQGRPLWLKTAARRVERLFRS